MTGNAKRLTLDIDEALHRRVKARAASEGRSVRDYCVDAIEQKLEGGAAPRKLEGRELVDHLRAVRRELFGDRVFSDSTEIIGEMREERSRQSDAW